MIKQYLTLARLSMLKIKRIDAFQVLHVTPQFFLILEIAFKA